MSTSDKFRKFSEMNTENDFIQALEKLVSGNAAVDSSASGTYETGINRPLGRLARNTDALLDVLQATKSCVLEAANNDVVMRYTSGGEFYITGTTGIRIRLHSEIGGAKFNKISSSSSPLLSGLSAGNVIYVILNRTSDATISFQPAAANWNAFVTAATNSDRLDYLVFGLVTPNNDVALFNGTTLRKDQQLENALATDSQYGQKFIQQQNRNVFLTGGGTITVDTSANTFQISADLKIHVPGNGTSCVTTISAATASGFSNGSCLFVSLDRDGSSTATLTSSALSAVTIDKDTDDLFIVAYREGNITFLATGDSIQDGDQYRIDESPVYSLHATDPYTSTTVTVAGGVDVKTSAGMIVEATSAASGNSTLRLRSRVDNRDVFIRTTLTYTEPNPGQKRLTFGSASISNGIIFTHPDYGVDQNRILPTGRVLDFSADRQVAYVVLNPIGSGANSDYTTVVANNHASAGHAVPADTSGNIYVCPIGDVPEDDADVFVFAQRVDGVSLDVCILWDGTRLVEGIEAVSVGRPLDRLLISQNYTYSQPSVINFDWVRSGQADRYGNTVSSDRIAIRWQNPIVLYWPAGGSTTINDPGSSSPLVLSSSATIAYITVSPESRRLNTTATLLTASNINSLDSVADVVLFSIHGPYTEMGADAFPHSARSNLDAYSAPVSVFGNRKAYQRWEASGGATTAITGNANLGRETELLKSGDYEAFKAFHKASYPSLTNPFVTQETHYDLKVGQYSGAEHEGGSATFTEKFSVAASDGDVVTKGTVQAVNYNYGDASGSSTTKSRSVLYSGKELINLAENDIYAYTTDFATASGTLGENFLELDSSGQIVSSGGVMRVKALSVPGGPGTARGFGMEVPGPPAGCTLTTIRVYIARGSGYASRQDVRLRVSRNSRFTLTSPVAFTSLTGTSGTTLLTDGTTATVGGVASVEASSYSPVVLLPTLYPLFHQAIFDFSNASVSDSSTSKLFEAGDKLWIRVTNADLSDSLEVVGVRIFYTGSSVEDFLGAS